jgi:hypothetical protein
MEQLGRAGSTRRSAYAALRSAFYDAVIDSLLAANLVQWGGRESSPTARCVPRR